ncbi:unnamed protein product, partial [Porites evermanni]
MASPLQKAQTHDDRVHGSRKVKVTILASEWGPSNRGLSTINRELAIQLAKFPELEITFFLPKCSQEDKNVALDHKVKIVEATPLPCFEQLDWLCFPPDDLEIDIVVGHGVKLGKQAQIIKKYKTCKWVQVVHTDPEERGMFKSSSCPISKGEEKHKNEVGLCEMADHVVGVGPKLSEAFRSYLSGCNKDGNVFELTPGVFEEFETVKQVSRSDRQQRRVLVFGRGAVEDFELEGFDIAGKAIAALQDTRLVFVGARDGKREEIANRLMEYGVPASRLNVKGFDRDRESFKRLLQQADLAVMPSRTEGFGLTGLEAMSAGLPVLVSRNSGFGEALRSAAFGSAFVIESEDPTVWTAAIEKILNKDRECRLEEAVNLRDSYGRKYNWAKHIKELVEKMISLTHEDSPKARSSFETKCNAFLRMESMTDDHEEPSIEIENNQRTNSYHDEQLVSETSLPRSSDCVTKADAASGNPTKISTNTDSQSQNSRKRKMSEFACNPDSVVITALIEVLISWNTHDLTVAQQRILKEELEQSVHKYRRHQDLSSSPVDSSVARLTEYIEKAYEVAVMMVKSGSLIITVQCLTLKSLESLWNDSCSGYLNDIVERFLVTDELKRKLGMGNVRLKTTIEEENYLICKKSFFENSG